jgi:lipopolysaccharide export system protein LptC
MRYGASAVFPLVLMGALAGLTYWLDRTTTAQEQVHRANNRHDPDFIVERFSVQRFDRKGDLVNSLTAESMTHYPDDNSTDVVKPELTYYNQLATKVSSQAARLLKDGKEVQLTGSVKVFRPGAKATPATLIQSEALTVFPDDDHVIGNAPVTITRGKVAIHGNALDYDGKQHISRLSGRVHGEFKKESK